MGSCNTKQEVVSQTSAKGTPVAAVLKSTGNQKKRSKVHASDSMKTHHTDSGSEDLKFFVAVSGEDDKAKLKDDLENVIDVSKKEVKQSGVQTEALAHTRTTKKGERRKNRQIAKAMRIGDFAVIVEIKDQGKYLYFHSHC